MTFIKILNKHCIAFYKSFKNRDFKRKIKEERAKKYLFSSATSRKKSFFSFYTGKKRAYYFNNIIGFWNDNREAYQYAFMGLGIFLIFSSVYVVLLSPYFRVSPSKVIIERLDTITDINIAYKSIESVYGSSIFFIDKRSIVHDITSLQKNIKSTEVSRLFPNGLKIILTSYKPQFNTHFAINEKDYSVTSNGILIYQKSFDPKLYTLDIVDPSISEGTFFDYKEGVPEVYMTKILFARDKFKETFPRLNISKLTYFKLERELHISLDSGTKIILELDDTIDKQFALLKFYNDSHKDALSLGEMDYIDIRTLWKLFICREKPLCNKNLLRIYGDYYKK